MSARIVTDPVHLAPPRALYVHVPFCAHRCGYCDFTLVARRDELIPEYLQALDRELETRLGAAGDTDALELDTLYFGGGTPTHLPPEQLRELFDQVTSRVRLTADAEFTVEANPANLDRDRIDALVAAGVNRLSLGVQSLDSNILRTLERDHSRETVRDVFHRIRDRIDNISVDLIFGVPGQTLELWHETLDDLLFLEPTHVSTYGLTFEKGTAFWTRREKEQLQPVPDDLEHDMYALVMQVLEARGYAQYEISSFARPGRRSRHNQVYWSGRPYHGFGPGAARYLGGVRETNHRSVTTWIKKTLAGEDAVMDREQLSDEDRARERLVLGLRQVDGIELAAFERETGFHPEELAPAALDRHTAAGLLTVTDGRLRLTPAGRFLADTVIVDLL